MEIYRVLGTTDTVTTCEICGRVDLKGTLVLTCNGEITYAGSDCGAQLAGRPANILKREARTADRAAVEAARIASDAITQAWITAEQTEVRAWAQDHYTPVELARTTYYSLLVAWRAAKVPV